MIEIERKFLVLSHDFKKDAIAKEQIVQGFLNTDPHRTVRVRIKGDNGFLTIKGKGNDTGVSRFEWEVTISVEDASALLLLAEPGTIEKVRYTVRAGAHLFEVDEFFGDNEGLLIAEVELSREDESFERPSWLGEEVSGQERYYNSQLGKNPFKNW
tara:strand:+ start:98402 stop:98869 length:468 start_codon:yes stop_codon:yes gene_type:complete